MIPESVIFWIGAGVSLLALLGAFFAIETQAERDGQRSKNDRAQRSTVGD
jgi:hypothetical protein